MDALHLFFLVIACQLSQEFLLLFNYKLLILPHVMPLATSITRIGPTSVLPHAGLYPVMPMALGCCPALNISVGLLYGKKLAATMQAFCQLTS